MKKLIYLIPIAVFFISCNQTQKQTKDDSTTATEKLETSKTVADTITNWQLYKDSELLFKSNILESKRSTAVIKKSDKYKELSLRIFYDYKSDLGKKRIQLLDGQKLLATIDDARSAETPITFDKVMLDGIRMKFADKELTIKYRDAVSKNGIVIGMLKLTND
jgi:hypothetical protein